MELKDIIEAQNSLEAQTRKKKAQREKLDKQIARLQERSQWIEGILRPLAKLIKKERGYYSYEILGPFGLPSSASIWFWTDAEGKKEANLHDVISLNIVPSSHKHANGEDYTSIAFEGSEDTIFSDRRYECGEWSLDQILHFMDSVNNLVVTN